MGKLALISLILLGSVTTAAAEPAVEWSSWVRLGYGMAQTAEPAGAPRLVTPSPSEARQSRWEAALGADLTLPIGDRGDLRLGAWGEARTSSLLVGGAELLIAGAPDRLDMFLYEGEGVLVIRAGGNHQVVTGSVSYGYRAPWKLWGPWDGCTRYMIGVRLVATATRDIENPADWSMSAGLEVEPVGALRYLLGIRSWY